MGIASGIIGGFSEGHDASIICNYFRALIGGYILVVCYSVSGLSWQVKKDDNLAVLHVNQQGLAYSITHMKELAILKIWSHQSMGEYWNRKRHTFLTSCTCGFSCILACPAAFVSTWVNMKFMCRFT